MQLNGNSNINSNTVSKVIAEKMVILLFFRSFFFFFFALRPVGITGRSQSELRRDLGPGALSHALPAIDQIILVLYAQSVYYFYTSSHHFARIYVAITMEGSKQKIILQILNANVGESHLKKSIW